MRRELSPKEIHVWRADLYPMSSLGVVAQNVEVLSAEERARAASFRFEKDRRHFVAARATLRFILAEYLDAPPAELGFSYGTRGKPALRLTTEATLHFSVAHSADLAMYAISADYPVGIDVELVRDISDREGIADRFLSSEERQWLEGFPGERRTEMFFRIWTCKEALLKATGEGLTDAMKEIPILLAPDGTARLMNAPQDFSPFTAWRLEHWEPAPGYAAALAVKARDFRTRHFVWQA